MPHTWFFQVMSEKFGISTPDTDVRALLINPAKWAESLAYIETVVERDTSTPLLSAFHMYMVLNDNYKAFAFSASKRIVGNNTHYAVSLDHIENGQASEAFCGKLRCNSKGTEFAIYDDSNDPYGLKTGKPRRELGIISYKKKLLGPNELIVVMPRVRKDGACAQFRPQQPEESMIQLFKAGRVEHMFILKGSANVAPGGMVELVHGGSSGGSGAGKVVFQAYKRQEGDWCVKYMHPLSCFQAFNICISIFHNPITAGLHNLPAGANSPIVARYTATSRTLPMAGDHGPAGVSSHSPSMAAGVSAANLLPSTCSSAMSTASAGGNKADEKPSVLGSPTRSSPLSQSGGLDLAGAKPGAIINTASLEGLSHPVYTMTVQGAKVYSGLYSGNIQV